MKQFNIFLSGEWGNSGKRGLMRETNGVLI